MIILLSLFKNKDFINIDLLFNDVILINLYYVMFIFQHLIAYFIHQSFDYLIIKKMDDI